MSTSPGRRPRRLSAAIPLHHQLSRIIRNRIVRGQYERGGPIPSERALCDEFGVSRITLRRALDDLSNAGYLERGRGRPARIALDAPTTESPAAVGYLEDLVLLFAGTGVRDQRIDVVEAPPEVAVALGLARTIAVTRMTRTRTLDGSAFCVASTYTRPELAETLTSGLLASASFVEVLDRATPPGVIGARQRLRAEVANDTIGAALGIRPGSPVLGMTVTYFAQEHKPIAFTRYAFPAERYIHAIDLGRVESGRTATERALD